MIDSTTFEAYGSSAGSTWTNREAAHLLGRLQYGFNPQELAVAVDDGLVATVTRLLERQPESAEFSNADSTLRQAAISTGSIEQLKYWWLHRIQYSANPHLEKLTLFWHNHFATSNAKVRSVPLMLAQNQLIRTEAIGDFKRLLHGMTRDVAMLVWLDGNANRKRHPNENFAREIMELFALGVGNYSEKDIQEAARAFTGWHVRDGEFWMNRLQHDESAKTVFGKTGTFDGNDIVDLCLAQPACPRFLAMKLAKTFVCPEPSTDSINLLANRIRWHDFNLKHILHELFTSQWFFQSENRRCLIKSPLDHVVGTLRTLTQSIRLPEVQRTTAEMGQNILEPPSVKGWEGGRLWITSSTLLQRANFATELTTSDKYGLLSETSLGLAGETGDSIVQTLGRWLLVDSTTEAIKRSLVDFHSRAEGTVEQRLRGLLQLVLTLPEYQLY